MAGSRNTTLSLTKLLTLIGKCVVPSSIITSPTSPYSIGEWAMCRSNPGVSLVRAILILVLTPRNTQVQQRQPGAGLFRWKNAVYGDRVSAKC